MRCFHVCGLALASLILANCATAPPEGVHAVQATASAQAGSIDGEFRVTLSGGAEYEIPMPVPPGINGAQPGLSLRYDSQGGDGLLGVGWQLEGLSRIDRTRAILAVDGFAGGVGYDANDRFALDGQRLIDVAQGGSPVYHTELESWTRVIPAGAASTGPDSFTATDKQGRTLNYGTTADSRIEAFGQSFARVWALASVVDRNGNAVRFRYAENGVPNVHGGTIASAGAYYPIEIRYTENGSIQSNRFVRFAYEPRPDVSTHYVGGYAVTDAARLAAVTTLVGDAVVSQYRLQYETAPTTGHSRLVSVQHCAGDQASAPCLPATRLGPWQDQDARFGSKTQVLAGGFGSNNGYASPEQAPRLVGDVNGDGRMDVVGLKGGAQVGLGGAKGFTMQAPWSTGFSAGTTGYTTQENTPRYLADANGDGLADLIGFATNGVQVGFSTGSRFDSSLWPALPGFAYPAWNPSYDVRTIADVNGDGLVDLVGFKNGVQVALAGPSGFAAPKSWVSGFSYTQHGPGGAAWNEYTPRVLADVNGDRRGDVVGFGLNGVYVALSTGSSFDTASWDQAYPYFGYAGQGYDPQYYPRMMADVNGDGLADIVGMKGGVMVALSTGKRFLPPQKWYDGFSYDAKGKDPYPWNETMPRIAADVNSDGMADLVGFNSDRNGSVEVILSTGAAFDGSGWDDAPLKGFGAGWNVDQNLQLVADFDGDGLEDVVGFGKDGVYAGLGAGRAPDLLTGIQDGIGARVDVVYSNLSDPAVYTESARPELGKFASALAWSSTPLPPIATTTIPVFPAEHLRGGRFNVAASHVLSNAPAVNARTYRYETRHAYADALYDLEGRGWLGFAAVTEEDLAAGLRSVSSLLQLFPFTGASRRMEHSCTGSSSDPNCQGGGALLQVRKVSYLCEPGAQCSAADQAIYNPYPNVYQVLASSSQSDEYEYGAAGFSTGKTIEYDAYGNPTLEADLGLVDLETGRDQAESDNVYTLSSYLNEATESAWRIGFVSAVKRSRSNDAAGLASVACGSTPSFDDEVDISLEARSYTADGRMNLASTCDWDSGRDAWSTTGYGDYVFGMVGAVTAPGGGVTRRTYEPTYHSYVETMTSPPDANGTSMVQHFGFDPRFGLQVAKTDFNGAAVLVIPDAFGRIVAKQGPLPGASVPPVQPSVNLLPAGVTGKFPFASQDVVTMSTRTMQDDGQGGQYYVTDILQAWPTPTPVTLRHTDAFDGLGRPYRRVVANGCEGGKDVRVDLEHDSRNLVTRRTEPYFEGATPSFATSTYDAYGRVVQSTAPAGDGSLSAVTRHEYGISASGTQVRVTGVAADPKDDYVKTISSEIRDGKAVPREMVVGGAVPATTSFENDVLGRTTKATDPGGQATSWTYDSLGRTLTTTAPALGTVTAEYGANGKVATRTTANGATRYEYDALDRLERTTHPDGAVETVAWDLPSAANGLGLPGTSKVTLADGSVRSSYAFDYDAYGRVVNTTLSVGGVPGSYVTRTDWDPLGRMLRQTFPDGSAVTNEYDACHLKGIALDGTSVATFADYDPHGSPRKIGFGTGANTATFTYAPQGSLLSRTIVDSGGTKLLDDVLSWNQLGQLDSIHDRLQGATDYSQSYTYEDLRLASADAPGTFGAIAYRYDPAGNMSRRGDYTFEYDGYQVKRGTVGGQERFRANYGPMGRTERMSAEGVDWSFGYDTENQLVEASNVTAGTRDTYAYDDAGRRILATGADGSKTVFVGGGYRERIAPDGARTRLKFLASPIGIVAAVVTEVGAQAAATTSSATTVYLHQNRLQTTLLLTDASGKALERTVFTPYGTPVQAKGAGPVKPRFAGADRDATTGLYSFGARDYLALTGRFLTADTRLGGSLTTQDALNRYAYALNNPILFYDPTGHASVGEEIAMFLIDALEIVAGVAITVLSGGSLTPIGATFIGAGISGAIYNIENVNKGGGSWAGWGIQEGIGAVGGLITGGVGAIGGAATGAVASAAESATFQATYAGMDLAVVGTEEATATAAEEAAAAGAARTFAGRVITGATAGSLGSIGTQITGNLLEHKKWNDINWWNVALSGAVGGLGGAVQGAIGGVARGSAYVEAATSEEAAQNITFTESFGGPPPLSAAFRGWTAVLMPGVFNTQKVFSAAFPIQW